MRDAGAVRQALSGPGVRRAVTFAVFITLSLGAWQAALSTGPWSGKDVPTPAGIGAALWDGTVSGELPRALGASLARLAAGYALSVAIGIALGSLLAASRLLDDSVGTLVLGVQSLPSVAWLPLAFVWFGPHEPAIIFVVFMGSVFAVAIATRSGAKGVPELLTRVGKTYGATKWQMYRRILLPGMMPSLISGLKLGWSFAWRGLLAGELIYAGRGLGQMLQEGRAQNDMGLMLAIIVTVIAIGLITDRLIFGRIESWVLERRGLAGTQGG